MNPYHLLGRQKHCLYATPISGIEGDLIPVAKLTSRASHAPDPSFASARNSITLRIVKMRFDPPSITLISSWNKFSQLPPHHSFFNQNRKESVSAMHLNGLSYYNGDDGGGSAFRYRNIYFIIRRLNSS